MTHQPPALFEGARLTDLVVPIEVGDGDQRDLQLAAAYAELWGVPLKLVHVETGAGTSDVTAIRAAIAAVSADHPDLLVDGVEVTAGTVAEGVTSVVADRGSAVHERQPPSRTTDFR